MNHRKEQQKAKIENSKTSGIFVGYAKLPSKMKEGQKNERKIFAKKECIDEVASVESMKEVERKLWLTHCNMLSEKLNDVVREKFSKTSGIFVGYAKLPSKMKEGQKNERKIFMRKECIDEVASVESMKELTLTLSGAPGDCID